MVVLVARYRVLLQACGWQRGVKGKVERVKGILSTPGGGVTRELELCWEKGILQVGCSKSKNDL